MKNETLSAINGMLSGLKSTDEALTEELICKIMSLCKDEQVASDVELPDFSISRDEAAFIIGKDVRTVDYYCRNGSLRRIKIGNSTRASGISAFSPAKATGMDAANIWATHIRYKNLMDNAA